MKISLYKILTIAVLLISNNLFASPSLGEGVGGWAGYKIKVKVNGIKDTVCYLAGYYGPKQYYKDTARVDANGVFVFEGKDELPGGIYSVILPGNTYFEFIVNEQNFYLETDTSNLVLNMKVKGSLENQLFYDHFHLVAALQKEAGELNEILKNIKDNKDSTDLVNKKLRSINIEVGDYKLKIIRENPQTLLAKIFKSMEDPKIPEPPKDENGNIIDSLFRYHYLKEHYFDNVDFSDERLLRTPVYHSRLMKYMKKMTPQIPDSINRSADHVIEKAKANKEMFRYTLHKIINTYETSKIMGMDAVFVHLAEKYYMTNQAYWVDSVQLYKISERVRKLKPILIGKQAPPIYHIKDRNGKLIPLYSVDAEYLILIFWDPDCGHCKKEMPVIRDVYEKYKDKGVKAYAVCTEVERDKWIAFMDEYHFSWIDVADFDFRSPFREMYDISSTPKVFLLDKDKKIIAKQIGSEQLGELLKRRLKL